ncbi:hypothetical protein BD626DRAFT_500736 [Schizophyllum amplum]|uniref:MYND-type domain-containing protein n=1 Tax=Schizophyllum amplum TaxID=97359 RepID=A0A550CAL9_9AGAR|nr:hypothetical protein BD626DRAFT_500736 [Auriculariopsis ampla]
MPTVTCFYCQKKTSDAKRCSRCRLVNYCSKACQTASWKATHKNSCKPHASLVDADGNLKPEPEFLSDEWAQLMVDKQLSKWLELWRSSFCSFTTVSLDLANHPPDRVVTHCLVIRVRPGLMEEKKSKQFYAVAATVESREYVEEQFPELVPIVSDPTDFTRPRFLLILENPEGEIRRVRLNQWNDLNVPKWREMPKEHSRMLAQDTLTVAVQCVNNMEPEEVLRMMRGRG